MPEPARTYRNRAKQVEAIRWIDHATSCDAVYRFLGVTGGPHLDHEVFEIPGGTYQNTTSLGGWIVRYPNGRLRACSDAAFTAEFEPATTPGTFAWGQSVTLNKTDGSIYIPFNDGNDYAGDVQLDLDDVRVLRDMLGGVLDEVGGSDV